MSVNYGLAVPAWPVVSWRSQSGTTRSLNETPIAALRPTVWSESQKEPVSIDADDDDALMALVQAGNEDAFRDLVSHHSVPLIRYCTKFIGDARASEDIAQDIFVQLWLNKSRYRPQSKFRVYLFTLARNRCRNRHRDEKVVVVDPVDLARSPGSTVENQLDGLMNSETSQRVQTALRSLPDKLREALLLRFDQGLSYSEIGQILGKPEATARTRVFHGIRKIRAKLEGVSRS